MKYEKADIDKISPKVLEAIRSNLDLATRRLKKGLFLYGLTGTGKTYAMHAIKKRADSIGVKEVGYVENWVEMLAEMRNNLPQSINYVNMVSTKHVVFIDDLGAEKQSEWCQEMFYLIVNRLYTDENVPIFATNLSLEDFQERYGDRIFSRLVEMCSFVELTGEDKRLEVKG